MRLAYNYVVNYSPKSTNALFEERILNFLNKKKLAGDFRTIEFFKQWFKKNRFLDIKFTDEDIFCQQIEEMIIVLNRKFDNNWDFHLNPLIVSKQDEHGNYIFDRENKKIECVVGYEIYIVLLYPEFTIKNSNDNKLDIKDLLVAFKLKSNKFNTNEICFETPLGTRATLSFDEYSSFYLHSHLPTSPQDNSDILNTTPFCIGTYTELEGILSSSWCDDYKFSDITFETMLYAIDTLVEWESLEGVPYISIDNIKFSTKNIISLNPIFNELQSYYNTIEKIIISLVEEGEKINFIFSEGKYSIKEDKDFHNLLKYAILHNNRVSQRLLYTMKVSNNIYEDNCYGFSAKNFSIPPHKGKNYHEEQIYTTIQGRIIPFTVVPGKGGEEKQYYEAFKVIPKFIDYAKQQLNKSLYKRSVRKIAIEQSY